MQRGFTKASNGRRKERQAKRKLTQREMISLLARELREMPPDWKVTEVVRKVAAAALWGERGVWKWLEAARAANVRAKECEAREAERAALEVEMAANEITIEGRRPFRKTMLPETIQVVSDVITKIEEQTGKKLTALDFPAIQMLANCYDAIERSLDKIAEDGDYVYAGNKVLPHPAHRTISMYTTTCLNILKNYGLTMAAKEKIKAYADKGEEDMGGLWGFKPGQFDYDE